MLTGVCSESSTTGGTCTIITIVNISGSFWLANHQQFQTKTTENINRNLTASQNGLTVSLLFTKTKNKTKMELQQQNQKQQHVEDDDHRVKKFYIM